MAGKNENEQDHQGKKSNPSPEGFPLELWRPIFLQKLFIQ
jgi:hypothetical protein